MNREENIQKRNDKEGESSFIDTFVSLKDMREFKGIGELILEG